MNKDLTCNQVSALLNFYIEDKLNPRLKEYVNIHLENCPACKKKVEELKKIFSNFKSKEVSKSSKKEGVDDGFMCQLSAYVDNELSSNENIKIKKMTISNPSARKELETMYKFKKVMHSAYEKTKNESKYDYSKDILNKVQDSVDYTTTYFYKLACVFVLLMVAIIGGFIYLYF